MFKRRAILAGAAFAELELLIMGEELHNMISYLMSDIGGGWQSDEIIFSVNGEWDDLLRHISNAKRAKPDYFFFYWNGHGFNDGHQQALRLNETEAIMLENFYSIAPRQLFILDTCRTIIPGTSISSRLPCKSTPTSPARRYCYRTLFDEYVKRCEPSLQIAYACSKGESAYLMPEGGYFTANLLSEARRWRMSPMRGVGYKSVRTLMKGIAPTLQHPRYYHSNRIPNRKYFPFSIRFDI